MKKVAVACDAKKEVQEFQHCEEFEIYETENGQVEKQWTIQNAQHKPDYLPLYLSDIGIKVVIADHMDNASLDTLNKRGVATIVGVHGDVEDNVESFLDGKLQPTQQAC